MVESLERLNSIEGFEDDAAMDPLWQVVMEGGWQTRLIGETGDESEIFLRDIAPLDACMRRHL